MLRVEEDSGNRCDVLVNDMAGVSWESGAAGTLRAHWLHIRLWWVRVVGCTPVYGGNCVVGSTPVYGGICVVGCTPVYGGICVVGCTPVYGGICVVGINQIVKTTKSHKSSNI